MVERLSLATITTVPEAHPEYATFEPYPVHGWVVRHPDGIVLVDTGVGTGNDLIDEWYRPQVTPLAEALATVGLVPSDISMVVLSHLHFDHCGQVGALTAPVYVQAAEWEAAQGPHYTVPEWAAIPANRLRLVAGDAQILPGVRLLSTPGHTPGHQSVVIEGTGRRQVVAAQCAFRSGEVSEGRPDPSNFYDHSWAKDARHSLDRIRSLRPATVHLSHDDTAVTLD
jgi:N-acyl homoserine lactone hydrolase